MFKSSENWPNVVAFTKLTDIDLLKINFYLIRNLFFSSVGSDILYSQFKLIFIEIFLNYCIYYVT